MLGTNYLLQGRRVPGVGNDPATKRHLATRSDARARRDRPGPTRPKEAASKTAPAPSVLLNVMRVHD